MAKVLLIEPDAQLAKTLKQSLSVEAHQVTVCTSAQQAISEIDNVRPDLVILELQLPVHNGIEFLYELRSYQDWLRLPVIIHSHVSPTQKAISPMLWDQLGVAAYLYKPATKLAKLSAIVSDTLAMAR